MNPGLPAAGGIDKSPFPRQPRGGTSGCGMMGSAAGAGKAAGPPDRWPFALEGHVTGSEAFAKAFIAPRA